MKEIKVGEFVRTNRGTIAKIEDTEFDIKTNSFGQILYEIFVEGNRYYEVIVKHRPNIIDLIEVKDVIEYIEQTEGREGTKVGETYITNIHSENELNEIKKEIQENGIKLLSIVTKEQFNQVKYEV